MDQIIKLNHPSVLVMFSGGLDSLAVLHTLLQQPTPVHIHHLHLVNKENRAEAERIAVSQIRDWYGPDRFTFSESSHTTPSTPRGFMIDADMTTFMAGYLAVMLPITSAAFGITKDDLSDPTLGPRWSRAGRIFRQWTKIPMVYPTRDKTKQQCWDDLPPDLRSLAWSCRRPRYTPTPEECGVCKTCKAMNKIRG